MVKRLSSDAGLQLDSDDDKHTLQPSKKPRLDNAPRNVGSMAVGHRRGRVNKRQTPPLARPSRHQSFSSNDSLQLDDDWDLLTPSPPDRTHSTTPHQPCVGRVKIEDSASSTHESKGVLGKRRREAYLPNSSHGDGLDSDSAATTRANDLPHAAKRPRTDSNSSTFSARFSRWLYSKPVRIDRGILMRTSSGQYVEYDYNDADEKKFREHNKRALLALHAECDARARDPNRRRRNTTFTAEDWLGSWMGKSNLRIEESLKENRFESLSAVQEEYRQVRLSQPPNQPALFVSHDDSTYYGTDQAGSECDENGVSPSMLGIQDNEAWRVDMVFGRDFARWWLCRRHFVLPCWPVWRDQNFTFVRAPPGTKRPVPTKPPQFIQRTHHEVQHDVLRLRLREILRQRTRPQPQPQPQTQTRPQTQTQTRPQTRPQPPPQTRPQTRPTQTRPSRQVSRVPTVREDAQPKTAPIDPTRGEGYKQELDSLEENSLEADLARQPSRRTRSAAAAASASAVFFELDQRGKIRRR